MNIPDSIVRLMHHSVSYQFPIICTLVHHNCFYTPCVRRISWLVYRCTFQLQNVMLEHIQVPQLWFVIGIKFCTGMQVFYTSRCSLCSLLLAQFHSFSCMQERGMVWCAWSSSLVAIACFFTGIAISVRKPPQYQQPQWLSGNMTNFMLSHI